MNERARVLTEGVTETIETESQQLSFDEAFTLHHRAVYRTAYSFVRDVGLAEDVTQEVFLKLHHHINDAALGEHLKPWLLRVAINCARNTLRGRARATAREEEFSRDEPALTSYAEAPDDEYERQAAITEARRALDKIREPMRSCLILQQQGLSYEEIAETLSINSVNVGSLIARGRKEFVRVYGKVGGRS